MKDFKLLICCRWFILSATTTVNNCEIPDSSKSACNAFSLVVFRLATQKLSLKWLIDFSTLALILYVLLVVFPFHFGTYEFHGRQFAS